jgi:hypothetical protein
MPQNGGRRFGEGMAQDHPFRRVLTWCSGKWEATYPAGRPSGAVDRRIARDVPALLTMMSTLSNAFITSS